MKRVPVVIRLSSCCNGELKVAAARAFGHDRDRYTSAKDEFITTALHAARTWAKETGWHLGN